MSKGEKTRRYIIQRSAELFNVKGYAGASLSDITEQTGIKRGGIYRYFESKDEIAAEAFDYATSIVGERFAEAAARETTAIDKIRSMFRVYSRVVEDPPFVGGCPLLNTAVECDDAHPALREKALHSMKGTLTFIVEILTEGARNGELRSDIDLETLAGFILSALEGGIMLSKLEGDDRHVKQNMDHVSSYLEQYAVMPSR